MTGAKIAPSASEPRWTYRKGLHDLGEGAWAWLQPDGGWGWSNAGLIADGGEALLIDTLFDARLTGEMLTAMDRAVGVAAGEIDILVNTHANGDHTFGNGLVAQARVIASRASAAEMVDQTPGALAALMRRTDELGRTGAYLKRIFGAFDFENAASRAPTETFSGALSVGVGGRTVDLYEVGPAHTAGDVIVHDRESGIVFTGDILFIDGTPLIWAGPVSNWLRACDLICSLAPRAIVPGHGPITDETGVKRVQDYLRYIDGEARSRFEAGMAAEDAVLDIALGDFASWGDAERLAVNVASLYREYRGGPDAGGESSPFRLMAALASRGPKR
ncbi:MAG: MBL fold metallo-hydrolase [Caulobacteraceae bacterium]